MSAVFVDAARADIAVPGDVFVADYVRGLVRIEPTSNRQTVINADIDPGSSRLRRTATWSCSKRQ